MNVVSLIKFKDGKGTLRLKIVGRKAFDSAKKALKFVSVLPPKAPTEEGKFHYVQVFDPAEPTEPQGVFSDPFEAFGLNEPNPEMTIEVPTTTEGLSFVEKLLP